LLDCLGSVSGLAVQNVVTTLFLLKSGAKIRRIAATDQGRGSRGFLAGISPVNGGQHRGTSTSGSEEQGTYFRERETKRIEISDRIWIPAGLSNEVKNRPGRLRNQEGY